MDHSWEFKLLKKLTPSHKNWILLEMVQSLEAGYGNASRRLSRVTTPWHQPGNVESCNSLMFLMVFGTSFFSQEAKAALVNSTEHLGFEDVAFSRKESILSSVSKRGWSIVGKSFGSLKRSFYGSKALSTGGATKILIEMLWLKFGWETYETRMFIA